MKQERNAQCECGSGKKYKKCCLLKEWEETQEWYKKLYTPPEIKTEEQFIKKPREKQISPFLSAVIIGASLWNYKPTKQFRDDF